MWYSIISSVLLAHSVSAWLPQDRDLAAFNQTLRFEKLGKRFEPSLPSGVTKIRGVNFGGESIEWWAQEKCVELTRNSRMAYLRAMANGERMGQDGLRFIGRVGI